MIINIKDTIESPIAVRPADAEKLYCILRDNLKAGNEIILSFLGITDFISSFLNASVGKLYNGDFQNDFVDSKLSACDLDDDDRVIYERVITRAKDYYANPEHYDFTEVLYDNE